MKFIEQSSFSTQIAHHSQNQTSEGQQINASKSNSKKQTQKNSKISRWTPQQNVLYVRFLKQNLEKLTQKSPKRFLKFERMSFQIESKTPDQCRSHHQKMMMRFKSIENIITGVVPQSQKQSQSIPQTVMEVTTKEKQLEEMEDLLIESNSTTELKNSEEKLSMGPFDSFCDDQLFDVLFQVGMF